VRGELQKWKKFLLFVDGGGGGGQIVTIKKVSAQGFKRKL
jgi:hypothetical protein